MKQTIIKPHLTEKSLRLAQHSQYTFSVDPDANKGQIAAAVADMYKVEVLAVKTASMHGKVRKAGKRQVKNRLSDWKKAIVCLKSGQTIEAFQVTSNEEQPKK